MGRNKAPFPSIVHMKLLMELYRELHSIPYKPEDITDTDITIELMKCLRKDQVISGDSKNLVEKLRGNPFIREVEKCDEGIEVSILNKISEIILKSPKIKIGINNDDLVTDNKHYWSVFKSKVGLPSYFDDLYSKIDSIKYYKYIKSKEQREQIDNFVKRKVGEFLETKEMHNYCIYFYNEKQRQVETGVLTIDSSNTIAILKYFSGTEDNIRSSSVQRTDVLGGFFQLHNSVLYLNLCEEDENKKHLRTNLCLSVPSTNFLNLSFLKGSYSTTINHGEVPIAGVIILERKESFAIASSHAKAIDKIDSKIFFELIGQRIEIPAGKKLNNPEDFSTKRIYNVLNDVKGAYILGFIKKPENKEMEKNPYITIGMCYIYENGMYDMRIAALDKVIKGHVNNKIYFNHRLIKLANFLDDGLDDFRYAYTLKVVRNKTTYKVERLIGLYSGISEGIPRGGEIILIKLNNIYNYIELLKFYDDFITRMNPNDNIYSGRFPAKESTQYKHNTYEKEISNFLFKRNGDEEKFIYHS